jgi:hypothetical protein
MKRWVWGSRKRRILVTSVAALLALSANSSRSLARGVTGWSNCQGRVTIHISCGGFDPKCRVALIEGVTDASGGVDAEVDWDDGNGFGENQQLGNGPGYFDAVWLHSYPANGLYHIKMELEDGDGNKCHAEGDANITG